MSLLATYNYLVPAAGTTSAYILATLQNAVNQPLDFSQVSSQAGLPFNPSGVVIDNTLGTVAVTIVITPTNFKITCPIGKQMGMQYPAPAGHTATITGNLANLAFVDYPVIPYQF